MKKGSHALAWFLELKVYGLGSLGFRSLEFRVQGFRVLVQNDVPGWLGLGHGSEGVSGIAKSPCGISIQRKAWRIFGSQARHLM